MSISVMAVKAWRHQRKAWRSRCAAAAIGNHIEATSISSVASAARGGRYQQLAGSA